MNTNQHRFTRILIACLILVSGLSFVTLPRVSAGTGGSMAPEATWPDIAINLVTAGLNSPVYITHAGDTSGRIFIVERPGRIRIFNGGLLPTPFLDISGRVKSGGEEGLLSIAFPPGFGGTKNHFYVYYTNMAGDNQVSRFSMSPNPDQADPNSEELILYLNHPTYQNHNGGQLNFGPDGYLYIGTGDGGGGGDPTDNAQNPASLLGKILRIDVETTSTPPPGAHRLYLPVTIQSGGSEQLAYRIPKDNPFVGVPGFRPEIWALGLRNPWRFSFDRTTGDLFIGDVGQNTQEEIDYQTASSSGGTNYGWNIMEGTDCYASATCDMSGLTLPIHTYTHDFGCSVTGGYVYRGGDYSGMSDIYFFGDYCTGRIWGLQRDVQAWEVLELDDTPHRISSFGEDQDGELYFADLVSGEIFQIVEVTGQRPAGF
jgi:glucose/arabinose dehydrogenase